MTNKFKVGDRVRATNIVHQDHAPAAVLEGIVVNPRYYGKGTFVLINFGAHFDGHSDRAPAGIGETCWWVAQDSVELATPIAPEAKAPQAGKQNCRILSHLLSGKSITQLEAFGVYGIFRLAARIHELKAKGHKIKTTMKNDANGKPYAEYSLVSRSLR